MARLSRRALFGLMAAAPVVAAARAATPGDPIYWARMREYYSFGGVACFDGVLTPNEINDPSLAEVEKEFADWSRAARNWKEFESRGGVEGHAALAHTAPTAVVSPRIATSASAGVCQRGSADQRVAGLSAPSTVGIETGPRDTAPDDCAFAFEG